MFNGGITFDGRSHEHFFTLARSRISSLGMYLFIGGKNVPNGLPI